jgi:hypothetical protein
VEADDQVPSSGVWPVNTSQARTPEKASSPVGVQPSAAPRTAARRIGVKAAKVASTAAPFDIDGLRRAGASGVVMRGGTVIAPGRAGPPGR